MPWRRSRSQTGMPRGWQPELLRSWRTPVTVTTQPRVKKLPSPLSNPLASRSLPAHGVKVSRTRSNRVTPSAKPSIGPSSLAICPAMSAHRPFLPTRHRFWPQKISPSRPRSLVKNRWPGWAWVLYCRSQPVRRKRPSSLL